MSAGNSLRPGICLVLVSGFEAGRALAGLIYLINYNYSQN